MANINTVAVTIGMPQHMKGLTAGDLFYFDLAVRFRYNLLVH